MDSSEKHSGASADSTGDPRKKMTPAAQVFSNYIFIPAARSPHPDSRTVRIHGAAVMVFADQSAEQVKLASGYATDIAGARLRARKDIIDELARGHELPPSSTQADQTRETNAMATEFACSACRTVITAPSLSNCPSCGLPLSAQAVPVVYPRKSVWPVIFGVLAFVFLAAWIAGSIVNHFDEKRLEDLHADLVAGKLNTPALFEARCGMPRLIEGDTLYYTIHSLASNDLAVAFPGKEPTYTINGAVADKHGKFTNTFRTAPISLVEEVCTANAK